MSIIDELKANEKPFGLMSEEMQAKAQGIGLRDFEDYLGCNNGNWEKDDTGLWLFYRTYRLRPDYEEEPEIEEWPIFELECNLRCKRNLADGDDKGLCIDMVSRDPDFVGFKFEDGQVELTPIVFQSDCSTKSICQFCDLSHLKIRHATHALFRRQK